MGAGQDRTKAESRTFNWLLPPFSPEAGRATCVTSEQAQLSERLLSLPPHFISFQPAENAPHRVLRDCTILLLTNRLFLFCPFQTVCTQKLPVYALSPMKEVNQGKGKKSFRDT